MMGRGFARGWARGWALVFSAGWGLLAAQTPLPVTVPVSEPLSLASAERGKALLLQRQDSGCVLCHQVQGLPAGGALGPSLIGLAERSTKDQARERIADARRFNPQTIMPAYFSTEGLNNVASAYKGQTILTAQGLEDILSYLFLPPTGTP
jgi:sulfur-oxidizing protein SoxX